MTQSNGSEPCQTPGAWFHTWVGASVAVVIGLPQPLALSEEQAVVLESDIHDAMASVLAPHFASDSDANHPSLTPLGANPMTEEHRLRCLVAEALEVFATTYVMLVENDPPCAADAANEVQQAHRRFTAALSKTTALPGGRDA